MVNPAAWRAAARHLVEVYAISERRSCRVLGMHRSTYQYRALPRNDEPLCRAIRALAERKRRWGCPLITDRLRMEGWKDNHKRIERIYQEQGLQVRKRKRKKHTREERVPLEEPTSVNQVWAMDFMSDAVCGHRKIRLLTVLDVYSRECLRIEVDTSIGGARVARILEELREQRGLPERIMVDNGPEFSGRALDAWAYARDVKLCFIEPGKPQQNAFIESFNNTVRNECLNEHWFVDLADARQIIEAFRVEYNTERPHSSVGRIPPSRFAERAAMKIDWNGTTKVLVKETATDQDLL